MKNKLSILIPTLESRKELLSDLVCDLIKQCGVIKKIKSFKEGVCDILIFTFDDVEIIIGCDNKQLTTGAKRNLLLSLATNDYVSSIDDDDTVYPYYISEVLQAIQYGTDCIGTVGWYSSDGGNETEWRLSKDYPNETIFEDGKAVYLRTTNHISIVKRELSLLAGYPNDKSNAEDKWHSDRLKHHLKTEIKISKPLYHYRFSTHNKEYT